MTAALHTAAAIGEIDWFDLDTPLLVDEDFLAEGLEYDGPKMALPGALGLGVVLRQGSDALQR
jgi:hypothetical protein